MIKTIALGCAATLLLSASAGAQGRGLGVGGGAGGGVGLGAGGMGAGLGGGMSAGAGLQTGPAMPAPPIARGRADTATSARGAADVLPNTRASEQGVLRGSRSTANATTGTSTDASARGEARRAATTDVRAGALVKNASGATIGRIESVTSGSAGGGATVTVRSGDQTWTLPQADLNASGDFLVTSRTPPAR